MSKGIKVGTALRNNEGKPDLAYLLTLRGGVEAAFGESLLMVGLSELGRWYRGEEGSLRTAILYILCELEPHWPEELARVSSYGASKYARGNYLAGMGLHVICSCLLRHVRKWNLGEVDDQESGVSHIGHIAWNALYLLHCSTIPELDDRVRAPEAK
jgi:hypothetical protein